MAVSTYDDIKTLVANVYELAILKAQEGNVIAQLVTVLMTRLAPRVYGAYSGGTFASIAALRI